MPPQQLPHIQQGIHPEGVGQSVLTSVLRGSPTVPADRGVFLEQTYRLQPEICRFISELAYEGRLTSVADCARHTVTGPGWSGGGLTALLIPHDGNSQKSSEEADAVTRAIQDLLANGTVTDSDGVPRPVRPEDIMVVAPYNLHVQLIASRVPEGVQVGTVDKFQGREAAVVFYALATSRGEDAPRGLGFLADRRRLNVAISRARALTVLVCSPWILDAPCHSVEDMREINGLCLYVEQASPTPETWTSV